VKPRTGKVKNMAAGGLIEHFAFLCREQVDNDMGTDVGRWLEIFSTRAALTYREGSEAVIAARLTGKQPAFLTIRRSKAADEITTEWCCRDVRHSTYDPATKKLKGHVYDIHAVVPDMNNRGFLRLSLERGGDVG